MSAQALPIQRLPDAELLAPIYLTVRPSRIAGRGLFTTKSCHVGEVLLIIAGEVIDEREAERREREEQNFYIYWNDDNYIDTAHTPLSRYLNHSCHSNVITLRRDAASRYLIASREIAPGEELVLDYEFDDIYALCQRHNVHCADIVCVAKNNQTKDIHA